MDAAHGADEAIELADLVEMAEFHLHAIEALSQGRTQPLGLPWTRKVTFGGLWDQSRRRSAAQRLQLVAG